MLKVLLQSTLIVLALSTAAQARDYTYPADLRFGDQVRLQYMELDRWVKANGRKLKVDSLNKSATTFTIEATNTYDDGASVLTKTAYLYQSSTGRYMTYDKNNPGRIKLLTINQINADTSRYFHCAKINSMNEISFHVDGKDLLLGSDSKNDLMDANSSNDGRFKFEVK